MSSRLVTLTITAALALVVAGTASAGYFPPPVQEVVTGAPTSGTWDKTHTYAVNGKKRACTLTRGAKCVGAKLRGRVKHHGDLRGANLRRADLRHADLRGANLAGADLRSANLKHADVRGANLRGAKFHYAPPVHGRKAKRGNAAFACQPDCDSAIMSHMDMRNADLSNTSLKYADLSYSDLRGANLYRANLYYADLTSTNLTGANLYFANLSRVTWNNTTCPSGVNTSTAVFCD